MDPMSAILMPLWHPSTVIAEVASVELGNWRRFGEPAMVPAFLHPFLPSPGKFEWTGKLADQVGQV
jgi:hypothetical protein